MALSSKPNAKGRDSGKWPNKYKKIYGPPEDAAWTWLPIDLIASPAWRCMSINTRRLIEFLLVENRNHAAHENGNLKATYDQLVDWGLSRRLISAAIDEAELLGLIKCEHGGRWAGTNWPSIFRLTFYADKEGRAPTNEWKGITEDAIRKRRKKKRQEAKKRMKNKNSNAPS